MNTEPNQEQEDDPYKVEPPPPRIVKWKVFFFLFHLTFAILSCTLWAEEDGTPNWLGFFFNFAFAIFRGVEIYVRYKLVLKLERSVRHFEALKRIVKTPVMQYDKETNTTLFNWLISLSPEDVDKLEKEKRRR